VPSGKGLVAEVGLVAAEEKMTMMTELETTTLWEIAATVTTLIRQTKNDEGNDEGGNCR
jgi:hypothetical protein